MLLFVFSLLIWSGSVFGYGSGMRAAMLGGPWELVVQKHADTEPSRYPVVVEDENKETDLDKLLPMLGSSSKLRIVKYLPDLKWYTYGVKDEAGGVVLKVNFKEPNLDTSMWIDSGDPKKRVVSSSIGGLMAVGIHDVKNIEKTAKSLADLKSTSYSLSVEEYLGSGKLFNEWENGLLKLANSAILVSAEKGDKKIQHALELNKTVNHEDGVDSMVFVFAKKGAEGGGGSPHGSMGGMMKK